MAADDCYVNSEGLNVKRKEHPSEKQKLKAKAKATSTTNARIHTNTNTNTNTGTGTATKKNTTSMNSNVNDHSIAINNRVDNHERDQGGVGENNKPQHSYLLDSVTQVMTESQTLPMTQARARARTPLKKQGDNGNINALNSALLNTTSTSTTTTTTPTSRGSVSGSGPVYTQTPTRMRTRPSIFGDDDGSVDSDEGNDPILNFIQSSGKHGRGLDSGLDSGLGLGSGGRDTYSGQSTSPSKSKPRPKSRDPNRFLADLDARIFKDNQHQNRQEECECDEESQQLQERQQHNQGQGQGQGQGQPPVNLLKSFVNTSNKMDWLRNVTQQDIQQSVSQLIPGIGKQNVDQSATTGAELEPLQNQHDSEDDDDDDDEEKVHVVQSSALIGDRENAELMKIRQKMNMDFITLGLDIVDKNRNYLWIVVTFFVMMFGYMLTKNKTNDGSI